MIYIKENKVVYAIYEAESEFMASEHSHLFRELEDAEDGHYILSNNGYYVPIVQTGRIYRTTAVVKGKRYQRKKPVDFLFFRMPACTRFIYNRNFEKGFTWERKYYRANKGMSRSELAFVKLIEDGALIFPAAQAVWGKAYLDKFFKLLNRELVFKEIAKRINRMSLKEELKNKGITESVLAEELKKLLEGDNVQGKKYAIEKITHILSIKEEPTSSEPQNEVLTAAEELSRSFTTN